MPNERADLLRSMMPLLTALPDGEPVTVGAALAHQHALLSGEPKARDLAAVTGQPLASDADIRSYLAREHYFKTWDNALAASARTIDRRFEAAADAIAAGDLATLERLLADDPALARARSAYGHRQTLLHHVGANGIELVRQWQSPPNAAAIARVLLAAGAEPDATCESYGFGDTALTLTCSSVHPHTAGVQAAIIEALVAGGARVDGPSGDSAPLWTATIWGYVNAVDALVRLGARADNLVLAAATGDVARVEALLGAPRTALAIAMTDKVLAAEHILEYALIYAAGLRRLEVVKRLLAESPDLTVSEPIYGATARSIAAYQHYTDVLALLGERPD